MHTVMQNIISPIKFFRCFTFLLHWLCLCLCIYILQDFSDFDTCSPITIRVSSLTHFSVCLRLCKKPPAFSVNILHLRAYKLLGSCFHTFRTLCCIPHDQYRFSQCRSFFLNSAAVCHDQITGFHQVMEFYHIQWFDQLMIFQTNGHCCETDWNLSFPDAMSIQIY